MGRKLFLDEGDFQAITPRLMTIPAAARYLGASVHSIRALVWSGELPYIALGQRHLIARDALDAWIAANQLQNKA